MTRYVGTTFVTIDLCCSLFQGSEWDIIREDWTDEQIQDLIVGGGKFVHPSKIPVSRWTTVLDDILVFPMFNQLQPLFAPVPFQNPLATLLGSSFDLLSAHAWRSRQICMWGYHTMLTVSVLPAASAGAYPEPPHAC